MADLVPLKLGMYIASTNAAPYCFPLYSMNVSFSNICYFDMIMVQTDANFTLFVGYSQT